MAGGFNALTVPEGYAGEAHPLRRDEPEGPTDPEHEKMYALTPAGLARLPVADSIELWLLTAPKGPLPYESARAKQAIELLSEAWGMGIVHRLAFAPATGEDLAEAAGLRRRRCRRLLNGLRDVGLVEPTEVPDDPVHLAPTKWLRRAVAPLVAAARAEHDDPPKDVAPFDALDFEAGMVLAGSLVEPIGEHSGRCRLIMRIGEPGRREPVGVTVEVDRGTVIRCEQGLDPDASAEASGIASAWLRTLTEQQPKRLTYEGDRRLARALVAGLTDALFSELSYAR